MRSYWVYQTLNIIFSVVKFYATAKAFAVENFVHRWKRDMDVNMATLLAAWVLWGRVSWAACNHWRTPTWGPHPPHPKIILCLGVFSHLHANYTDKLYLVPCVILCHCGNVWNDTCYEQLYKYCHPNLHFVMKYFHGWLIFGWKFT